MTGINQSVQKLEVLRKRAKQAYIYEGLLLLGMVAIVILVSKPLGLGIGVLAAVLHVCFFRREIDAYRAGMLAERLLRGLGCDESSVSFKKSGGHDLSGIIQEGTMPMNNRNGMIRHLFTGKQNRETCTLCDLSYVYEMANDGAGNRAASLSGCYIKLGMRQAPAFSLACCPEYMLPEGVVEAHYKNQGFDRTIRKDGRDYLTFVRSGDASVPDDVQNEIAELMRRANENLVLLIKDGALCAFLPRRYLGKGEPNYKFPVTVQQLETPVLWEIEALLRLKRFCEQAKA